MTRRMVLGVTAVLICGITAMALAGVFWLRTSPYWAGITLFAEDKRIENFRTMERVFPAKTIAASDMVRELPIDLRELPESYIFDGQTRSVSAFLEETVTTGLLVLQDGHIRHESYHLGADETSRFTSWSMAKSVLSALIGIALEEGHITSLDDPLDRYVPALAESGYAGVTIRHALTMSSGVGFDEDYDRPWSDVNRLFFSLAAGQPMVEVLTGLRRIREPGTYNDYISSDSIALGLVLEAATGQPNETYLEARLWQPMGAERAALWNTGRTGPVLAFCCLSATLRDFGRFGQLFLDEGRRDAVQIIPEDWVAASTRPSAPHLEPGPNPASSWTFGYGYHWWVPEGSRDTFLAIGIWGQYIFVDRRRRVVIVKTSADEAFDTRDHETVALFDAIAASLDPAEE